MTKHHDTTARDAFADDVPSIAIDALAPIAMPDALRLRAVAVLAIVLTAEEEEGRAMGLDDAEVKRRCRAIAAEQTERTADFIEQVRLMQAEA